MKKKALILDLDNTIYPVSSIGEELFKPLYQLISQSREFDGEFNQVKMEILWRPFQYVAYDFKFSEKLTENCLALLENTEYGQAIETFDGYPLIRRLSVKKFLVTTGFTRLQNSKVRQLGIENDFAEIYIIDPALSQMTKKDVFLKILSDHNYDTEDVLIVGDDLNSEIKAGRELGIETILFDFRNIYMSTADLKVIRSLTEITQFL